MDCFRVGENNEVKEGLVSVSYTGTTDIQQLSSLDLPKEHQLLSFY